MRRDGQWPGLLVVAVASSVLIGAAHAFDLVCSAPPAAPQVADFLARCGESDHAVVQSWQGMELQYDARSRGMRGRFSYRYETAVRTRTAILPTSVVTYREGPSQRLERFEVIVTGPDEERRWRQKDLNWNVTTVQDDGVVILDGELATAYVPGITVGDRVRVTATYRIDGWQGLPPFALGDTDAPCLTAACALRLPDDHEVLWATADTARADEVLTFNVTVDGRWRSYAWSIRGDVGDTLMSCGDVYPHVRVVPHLASLGGAASGSMVYGLTWADVGTAYLAAIEDRFVTSEAMASEAAAITGDAADTHAKIERLYAWVQRRCHYLRRRRSVSRTRADGSRWQRDLLDATVDRYPAGAVPRSDAASMVLLLKPDAMGLAEIPETAWAPGAVRRRLEGSLSASGRLAFSVMGELTGGQALRWRILLADRDEAAARRIVMPLLAPTAVSAGTGSWSANGLEDCHAPLQMSFIPTSDAVLPRDTHRIFLPRAMLSDLLPARLVAPCEGRLDWRGQPELSVSWQLELPADFALVAADSLVLEAPGLRWSRRCWQDGRFLHLEKAVHPVGTSLSAAAVDSLQATLQAIAQAEAGYFEIRQR